MKRRLLAALAACLVTTCVHAQSNASGPFVTPSGTLQFSRADRDFVGMLDKVIFNLLSNAFKFTANNGFVHVHIGKSAEGKAALIKVEDNGVGISRDALAHAFEPFYQGAFENYKGSGLGLALSKELIQSHAGKISVQSEKGKGTTFSILLPLGNAHLKPEEMLFNEEATSHLYEHEKIYEEEAEAIRVTELSAFFKALPVMVKSAGAKEAFTFLAGLQEYKNAMNAITNNLFIYTEFGLIILIEEI